MVQQVPPNLVAAIGPQPTEISVTYTIPNSSPSGYVAQGSVLASNPLAGSSTQVTVPNSEVWHIENIYNVGGAAVVDAIVITFVNNYQQNVMPALSSSNLSVLRGFSIGQTIPIPPAGTFASSLFTLAASASSGATTQVVKYKIRKWPL